MAKINKLAKDLKPGNIVDLPKVIESIRISLTEVEIVFTDRSILRTTADAGLVVIE